MKLLRAGPDTGLERPHTVTVQAPAHDQVPDADVATVLAGTATPWVPHWAGPVHGDKLGLARVHFRDRARPFGVVEWHTECGKVALFHTKYVATRRAGALNQANREF